MDKKFVINIKGKEFITYSGLLQEAHEKGPFSMEVQQLSVDWEKKCAYCTVRLFTKDDIMFEGVGSATQSNCGSMVKEHFVEMAHTRAKARALRDYLNIDKVCADELGDVREEELVKDKKEVPPTPNTCVECGVNVTQKVMDFSLDKFGRVLCFECQKK